MTITFEGIKPGRRMVNNGKSRTYTLVYGFHGDTGDTEYDVELHANCPRWGMPHPQNAFAYCNSVQIEQVADGRWPWIVTATFSTEFELNENPLFEPAKIEWDSDTYEEALEYDRNGEAILNSAGDPITDIFRERTRRVVTVTKNVSTVPDWIITAEDAVNSSAFFLDGVSVATGLAKLGAPGISSTLTRNGISYRELRMTFLLKKDGWALTALDRGFRYLDGSALKRITSGDGTDAVEPVCLDGSGAVLATPVTAATAVYVTRNYLPEYDFNTLPLT